MTALGGSFLLACSAGRAPAPETAGVSTPSRSEPDADVPLAPARAAPAPGPDEFLSLETRSEETAAWEDTQTRTTIARLHASPRFDALRTTLRGYRDARDPIKSIELRGAVMFSLEQIPATDSMAVFRSEPLAGKKAKTSLFQVSEAEAAEGLRVDFVSVSPRGRWVAVGTSNGGTEETSVRVIDSRTGADRGDRTADVRLGAMAWLPDETGFLYMRGRGRQGVPTKEQNRDLSVAYHTLGTPGEQDTEIVGSRAPGPSVLKEYDYCYPAVSPDGAFVTIAVRHGIVPEMEVFTKSWADARRTDVPWAHAYGSEGHVTSVALDTGKLLAVRANGDQGSVVEERSLAHPLEAPRLVYTSPKPIDDILVADGLLVVESDLSLKRLLRISKDGQGIPVGLPPSKSVLLGGVSTDPHVGSLAVQMRSWTEPPSWWLVPKSGRASRLGEDPRGKDANEPFVVRSSEIAARDGAMVPVTIVGPAGSGEKPPKYVWISAYGSYGFVLSPNFTPARRAFLEHGGAYVAVHVRGGGEKGRSWHEQGRGANKIRAVEDLIDVVKELRHEGFGREGGIFLSGASAGGIPVGGLLVREPGLVDAVLIESGITNATRLETASAIAAAQSEEFGTMSVPESARHVAEIDAFLGVRAGVKYPATMLTAGVHDVRVPYWQATKMVARLQHATAGTAPIFLRLTGGGHVSGTTMDEESATDAETIVFALSALHHPDFQ